MKSTIDIGKGNQFAMECVYEYLMSKSFPYSSVSVIYRPQDLGLYVMFLEGVREKVSDDVVEELKVYGFTYSFT